MKDSNSALREVNVQQPARTATKQIMSRKRFRMGFPCSGKLCGHYVWGGGPSVGLADQRSLLVIDCRLTQCSLSGSTLATSNVSLVCQRRLHVTNPLSMPFVDCPFCQVNAYLQQGVSVTAQQQGAEARHKEARVGRCLVNVQQATFPSCRTTLKSGLRRRASKGQ